MVLRIKERWMIGRQDRKETSPMKEDSEPVSFLLFPDKVLQLLPERVIQNGSDIRLKYPLH